MIEVDSLMIFHSIRGDAGTLVKIEGVVEDRIYFRYLAGPRSGRGDFTHAEFLTNIPVGCVPDIPT